MIRMIATDLDDTLLDAHSALTPRALAALRAAMETGCRVALSSGRMLEAVLPLAEQIGVNAPMLLYNGAMIYDHAADAVLHASRIPFALALKIAELLESEGYYLQMYPGRGYYCSAVLDRTKAYAAAIHVPATPVGMPMAEWLRRNPADLQKILLIEPAEAADQAQAMLREAFGGAISCMKSKPILLEISPEGVDKGRALAILAERLGVAREEIMAFGDGQNDVPMLEYAGEGWAVRNACEQALRCTDRVAPRNTQDGVAQIIEQTLRERRLGG